jgi:protein tyrosine/serine phosphatase
MSVTRARSHTAVALLVLTLAVPAAAGPRPSDAGSKPTAESALSKIRIDNFGRVNANYYRGAQPMNGDYADLAALGIRTLINLTSDDAVENEEELARRAGMSYAQIPMTTHVAPTMSQMVEFLRLATDPSRQPVYVHCVGGRHRTGVMTAVYRMTQDRWTGPDAFKEMKQFKFGADFLHREFKEFVLAFSPGAISVAPASEQPHLTPAR